MKCYNPENRHRRRQTWSEKNPEGRWRSFDYEELIKRDKVNLDIFWLKDKSLEDSDDLPDPDVLAQEIVDDMQTALDQFSAVVEGLCDVCVFGRGVQHLCHQQTGCLCPVALVSCGYRHVCSSETCQLKQNAVKGFCHSAMTTS